MFHVCQVSPQGRGGGGTDPGIHGNEMRDKCDGDRLPGGGREFLLDLGQMSMPGETVGSHTFVAFDKKKGEIRLAACTAYPAEGVCNDGGGIN